MTTQITIIEASFLSDLIQNVNASLIYHRDQQHTILSVTEMVNTSDKFAMLIVYREN
jgi:hypothetical protein